MGKLSHDERFLPIFSRLFRREKTHTRTHDSNCNTRRTHGGHTASKIHTAPDTAGKHFFRYPVGTLRLRGENCSLTKSYKIVKTKSQWHHCIILLALQGRKLRFNQFGSICPPPSPRIDNLCIYKHSYLHSQSTIFFLSRKCSTQSLIRINW